MIPSSYYVRSEGQYCVSFFTLSINTYLWLSVLVFFELFSVLPYLFGVLGDLNCPHIKGQTLIFNNDMKKKNYLLIPNFFFSFQLVTECCFLYSVFLGQSIKLFVGFRCFNLTSSSFIIFLREDSMLLYCSQFLFAIFIFI